MALLAFAGHASAGMPFQTARSLVDLSLEQLSNIVVTSVSRRDERLIQSPARGSTRFGVSGARGVRAPDTV